MADPTRLESCTASRGAKFEEVRDRLGHPFSRLGPPPQEHGRSFTGPWHYNLTHSPQAPPPALQISFMACFSCLGSMIPHVFHVTGLLTPQQNALNRTGCMFSVPQSGSVQDLILGVRSEAVPLPSIGP